MSTNDALDAVVADGLIHKVMSSFASCSDYFSFDGSVFVLPSVALASEISVIYEQRGPTAECFSEDVF